MNTKTFTIDNATINIGYVDLLEHLPGAVGIKNKDSRYVAINETAARLVGYKKQSDILGLTDGELDCPVAALHESFRIQDQAVINGADQVNLDIAKYADGDIHLFLSTKKKFLDNEQQAFVLFTMTELPILAISRIFTELNNKSADTSQLIASYAIKDLEAEETVGYSLTARQSECLFYLLRGKTMKEIAFLLKLSQRTVEEHINNLKKIFNCYSKSQLIEAAYQSGFSTIIPNSLLK